MRTASSFSVLVLILGCASLAKHNVAPSAERYVAGRNEGLKSFCTYERGFSEGRAGHAYGAVCPQPLAQSFLAELRIQQAASR